MTKREMITKANNIVSSYLKEDTEIDFSNMSKLEQVNIIDAIETYEEHLKEGIFGGEETGEEFAERIEKDLVRINKSIRKLQKKSFKSIEIKEMTDVIVDDLDAAWKELEEYKRSEQGTREREKLEQSILQLKQDGRRMAKKTHKFLKTEKLPILKGFLMFLFLNVIGLILFIGIRSRRRNKFFQELTAQRIRKQEMNREEMNQRLNAISSNMIRTVAESTKKKRVNSVNELKREIYKNTGLNEGNK